jgi:AbiJ N-terminal domain 4
MTQIPFSSRNRGAHSRIDGDFPGSGRIGLLHLLHDMIRKKYVEGWVELARELQRIARVEPTNYDSTRVASNHQAQMDSEEILNQLPWDKVYDFCERLHNHLAQEVRRYHDEGYDTITSLDEVRAFIASELQRLFLEEGLAFEFRDGAVQRRGRRHSVERVSRAEVVLGDPRLVHARKHYDKALQFFRNPAKPDYENAVKEAVCAVEALRVRRSFAKPRL